MNFSAVSSFMFTVVNKTVIMMAETTEKGRMCAPKKKKCAYSRAYTVQ